ncbi:unnamed protein product [Pleuronectes platessa]|uniref:Uncharacterized protein n=1 Tax=Pleuronectes platessa TaxID=8262 RepID=A0A9N7TIM6_PLEPL|nr:unnamed protein product [Pleuronectes platessa]
MWMLNLSPREHTALAEESLRRAEAGIKSVEIQENFMCRTQQGIPAGFTASEELGVTERFDEYENDENHMLLPSQSPPLNPIEHLLEIYIVKGCGFEKVAVVFPDGRSNL